MPFLFRQKKIFFLICLLALTAIGFGGYWWWQSQKVDNVVFGVIERGSSEVFAKVMKGEGFDKKNHINLIPNVIASVAESDRQFFAREGIDIAAMGAIVVAQNNLEGGSSRIIAPLLLSHISILTKKDSSVQSLDDLRGKKLSTRSRNTPVHQTIAIVLSRIGINVEEYFNLVFPLSIAEGTSLLERGDIDAGASVEPETSKLLAAGKFRETAVIGDIWGKATGEPLGFAYVVAHQAWVDQHTKRARRVVKMAMETLEYIHNNPQDFTEKYKDLLGIKTTDEIKVFEKRIPRIYPVSWDEKSFQDIKLQLETAKEIGILPSMPEKDIAVQLLKQP